MLVMGRHHKIEKVTIEKGVLSLGVDGSSLQINLKDVSGVLGTQKKKSNKSLRFHRLVTEFTGR